MKVDGQCHCGAIVYEAEVEPGTVGLCHCPGRSLPFRHDRGGSGIIWVAEDETRARRGTAAPNQAFAV